MATQSINFVFQSPTQVQSSYLHQPRSGA
eukprot:SAG31_NODE_36228_length_315_cov_0.949074_1_plen_28_part_10